MLYIPSSHSWFRTGFSRPARKELEDILRTPDTVPSRRNVQGITIDKIDSLDLDDGLWIEEIPNGYRLQISITDIAELIPMASELDKEAFYRATSMYFDTHIFHMFPKEVATDIASLNHKTSRKALTLEVDFDSQFQIKKIDLFESNFFNLHRLGYKEVNHQLAHKSAEFSHQLQLLHTVSKKLSQKRKKFSWFTPSDEAQRNIHIWGEFKVSENTSNIASFIVQECMVLANIEIAKYMIREKIEGIFRNHMPKYEKRQDIPKFFEKSYYSSRMRFHYGLWQKFYTHFTSPLRRYADLVNQRQLKASLRLEVQSYSPEDIRFICSHINRRVSSLVRLQRESHRENKALRKIRKIKKTSGKESSLREITQTVIASTKSARPLAKIYREIILSEIDRMEHLEPWILVTFLPSKEQEIKEFIKRRILSDLRARPYLNILKSGGIIDYTENFDEEWQYFSLVLSFWWKLYFYEWNAKDICPDEDFSKGRWKNIFVNVVRKQALSDVINRI